MPGGRSAVASCRGRAKICAPTGNPGRVVHHHVREIVDLDQAVMVGSCRGQREVDLPCLPEEFGEFLGGIRRADRLQIRSAYDGQAQVQIRDRSGRQSAVKGPNTPSASPKTRPVLKIRPWVGVSPAIPVSWQG